MMKMKKMKILGRSPKRILAGLFVLHHHLVASVRCFYLFRDPFSLLFNYLKRQNPESLLIKLRNGIVLNLSQDSSDIVTVYLIFCRLDYGIIEKKAVIADIGANIGIYSVFAAMSGARAVYAYEPCEESFQLLKKNILDNNFDKVIKPFNSMVLGQPSEPLLFPNKSNVMNSLSAHLQKASDDFALINVITFAEISKQLPDNSIVKLDCEGGEYDIVLNTDAAAFKRISQIRLEYHHGPQEQLFARFKELGYIKNKHIHEGVGGGYMWLKLP